MKVSVRTRERKEEAAKELRETERKKGDDWRLMARKLKREGENRKRKTEGVRVEKKNETKEEKRSWRRRNAGKKGKNLGK